MATSAQLRHWWKSYECNESALERIDFLGDSIRVAPETIEAWNALAEIMSAHNYQVRKKDTASYNCRVITGGTEKSLHSYGIALDVNWSTNPYLDHTGIREVVFSDKQTQEQRAKDVKNGVADTDMTPGMIADILAIKTTEGHRVFDWGGTWNGVKDAMHFEIDLAPGHLKQGIEASSVNTDGVIENTTDGQVAASSRALVVIARDGLRLRSGPGTNFDILRTLPFGINVYEIGINGDWVLVSLTGDEQADGHVHGAYIKPISQFDGLKSGIELSATGSFESIAAADIVSIFHPSAKKNVLNNWEHVEAGLRGENLFDVEMIAMALGTIKAETASFRPISEGVSKYNTKHTPFDLYDAGTKKGADLGNTKLGDGPRFKGRGFIQLTGRYNYTNIGIQIGRDLAADPELANDDVLAGQVLAQYLKNKESRIRKALADGKLKTARRLVNGGTHGFDRFEDAYLKSRQKFG